MATTDTTESMESTDEVHVVTRRIERTWPSVKDVFDWLPAESGQLHIERPFRVVGGPRTPVLRARGRLYGCGLRLARYTRVEVEVDPWSHRVSELRVRPVRARLAIWSRRRQRRFFDLAHESADELARWLDDAAA
jgi:hypothetical protein